MHELLEPALTEYVEGKDVEWRGNELHFTIVEHIVDLNTAPVAVFDSFLLGIDEGNVLYHCKRSICHHFDCNPGTDNASQTEMSHTAFDMRDC